MSNQINWNLTWTVTEGKEDQFRALIDQFTSETKANESGTLGYTWYNKPNTNEWIVSEWYEDSNAALAHIGNVGPKLGVFNECSAITSFTLWGTPSDELNATLEGMCGQLNIEYNRYNWKAGFVRETELA